MTKEQLFQIGLRAAGPELDDADTALLRGIAAMLNVPNPRSKAVKSEDTYQPDPAVPFTANDVHRLLLVKAGDVVICQPAGAANFAAINAHIKATPDLVRSDLDALVDWLVAGGLSFWSVKPRFDHVAKHFLSWIGNAREWKAGRTDITGKPVTDASDVWDGLR